jgi:hypothetical protein
MVLQEIANSSLRWIEVDTPGKEEIAARTKVFLLPLVPHVELLLK